jgi:hypothetical protein
MIDSFPNLISLTGKLMIPLNALLMALKREMAGKLL